MATLIFTCEGQDHEIELIDRAGSSTLAQLSAWLPATTTIHCAKIAGCHVYWPSPILADLEEGTDIHRLPPGSFLYYPDRQYLEIIYDELQAETAAVTHLGQLKGDVEWLRAYATRQRREAGTKPFTASLRLKDVAPPVKPTLPAPDTAWGRVLHARRTVWEAEPAEIASLLANTGHNIPFGPMATADGYFRFVQESLWQIWAKPELYGDAARRAIAVNAMRLGISRIGHYCHLTQSEALLTDAIAVVEAAEVPLQDVLAEVIFYCSRMSNWVDSHIPWFPANELTKHALGRTDLIA